MFTQNQKTDIENFAKSVFEKSLENSNYIESVVIKVADIVSNKL